MTPFFAELFLRRMKNSTNIKKLKSLSEGKIQTHFYTRKHVSYTKKTSACLRSIPWLCHCKTRFPKYSVGFAHTLAIFLRYIYLPKISRSVVTGILFKLFRFFMIIDNLFYYNIILCAIINDSECVNIRFWIWESLTFAFNRSIVPQTRALKFLVQIFYSHGVH